MPSSRLRPTSGIRVAAIVAGRPLVLSRSGNLDAFATAYAAAVVVDPTDAVALSEAIAAAIETEPLMPDNNRHGAVLSAEADAAASAHHRFYCSLCT